MVSTVADSISLLAQASNQILARCNLPVDAGVVGQCFLGTTKEKKPCPQREHGSSLLFA